MPHAERPSRMLPNHIRSISGPTDGMLADVSIACSQEPALDPSSLEAAIRYCMVDPLQPLVP